MDKFTNRLIHEKSPYLQQHAHNPVDWFPWGNEAFEKAKQEDKPIFLSIGYATCHWCHVMEKESFEDVETAQILNEVFVNIKVDREELPEVDAIYMDFAQVLMSTSGGWPLNLILTPDLKPFFAVTYLPKKGKHGLMGLQQFVAHIQQLWKSDEREQLVAQAGQLVELFTKTAAPTGADIPSLDYISSSVELMFDLADPVYGGMKGEPKFPLGYQVQFLLEYAKYKADSRALFYVDLTLDKMASGGIYDQIGGGFSRYSVDEKWMVPHFEKMLYDNALLAKAYLDAWKMTQNPRYQAICKDTLHYILRELTGPDGGFYSAEDADSEGGEGRYYTWTPMEILHLLSKKQAELFCSFYGVSYEGNFEGKSVLHETRSMAEFAEMHDLAISDLEKMLNSSRKVLFEERKKREKPFTDDKVITAWNGLAIDALIKAGAAFKEQKFIDAGKKAADFIFTHLWKNKKLFRRWRDGDARFSGCLDDYACMIKAAISLFEEGLGCQYLQYATEMAEIVERHFKVENGAFYFSEPSDAVLVRRCEFYDGAEPSGNAVHAENLFRLYQITLDDQYLAQMEDVLRATKHHLETYPPGACYMLKSLFRYLDPKASTVLIALDDKNSLKEEIARELRHHYAPHIQVLWLAEGDEAFRQRLPVHADKKPIDGQTAVYICQQDRCLPPLLELEDIVKAIHDF